MYLPSEFARALQSRRGDKMSKAGLFDPAPKDATTHQPGVDLPDFVLLVGDQDADDSVVAEAIGEPDLDQMARRIFHCRSQFAFGISTGRQVELI